MVTKRSEAAETILERVLELASKEGGGYGAEILALAEAYAWIRFPNQSHGKGHRGE